MKTKRALQVTDPKVLARLRDLDEANEARRVAEEAAVHALALAEVYRRALERLREERRTR